MGKLLQRIGAFAVRRRWTVIIGWALILVAISAGALAFSKPTNSAFAIPGTESQRAIDLLAEKFPGSGGAAARVVVAAPAGHKVTEPGYAAAGRTALAEIAEAPQVIGVSPLSAANISKDGRIAYVDVNYAVPVDKVGSKAKDALTRVAQQVRRSGLEVEFSGGVIATSTEGGNTELYGVVVAFVVLTITLGSLVAAGLPLVTALVGVAAGLLGIKALSAVVSLNSTAPTLALMLGLAVGIDYTLFILSRHRQNLADGMSVDDSIALSTATAGGAVLFAGLTVVVALAALAVVGIPFLTVMGLAAAGTVAVIVLIALTFVPAVLALLGRRVNSGRVPVLHARTERLHGQTGFGARWARVVTRKPLLTAIACVLGVGVVAIPVLDIRLGLPDDGTKPTQTTERRAYDLLTEGFGPGFNGPLTLVLEAPRRGDLANLAGSAVEPLRSTKGVAAVGKPVTNKTGDVAIIAITPSTGPSSEVTKDLVARIRAAAADAKDRYGVQSFVTGRTASNIDVSDKLASALPVYLVVIVVIALLLLMIVFRSLLVPIKAVVGFLLSVGASFGATVFVFQEGHLGGLFGVDVSGPIVSFLPVLLVGILFGLAMDYEVFLVSRIREAFVRDGDPDAAITTGMGHSARVVTAAGLIMVGVFGSFVFGDDPVIKSIGLALAVGVAVDAFVVRMTLVPAILTLLGRRAWSLPSWLAKILPDLDLEGTRVTAREG